MTRPVPPPRSTAGFGDRGSNPGRFRVREVGRVSGLGEVCLRRVHHGLRGVLGNGDLQDVVVGEPVHPGCLGRAPLPAAAVDRRGGRSDGGADRFECLLRKRLRLLQIGTDTTEVVQRTFRITAQEVTADADHLVPSSTCRARCPAIFARASREDALIGLGPLAVTTTTAVPTLATDIRILPSWPHEPECPWL